MKKKFLTAAVLTLCAVALVVGSVLTTIALLTASSGVSNVFTVGNISIAMWESKVNSDGERVDASGNKLPINSTSDKFVKVDTNSYHLVPGKTYIKDPTIYIQSALGTDANVVDNMYLFVKSSNMIRRAEAGNYNDRIRDTSDATPDTPLSMREQMEKYGWVEFVRSDDGTEIVWVYGTRDKITGAITPTVVNKNEKQLINGVKSGTPGEFRLCDTFTTHQHVDTTVYGAASVTFTAFAIQTTGFQFDSTKYNAEVTAAWKALKESFPYKCGIDNPVNPYNLTTGNAAYEAVGNVPNAKFDLLTPPNASQETPVTPPSTSQETPG